MDIVARQHKNSIYQYVFINNPCNERKKKRGDVGTMKIDNINFNSKRKTYHHSYE